MAILQVRDFPDDLHLQLVQLAERERRSLAQQVLVLLMEALQQSESNKARRQQLLADLKKKRPIKSAKKLSDPVKILREDRER